MFQALYQLYKTHNNSLRIPLEDFSTESFAGILKMHPKVLFAFCDLLGLPKEHFRISTQRFYNHNLLNCFVDLVLENENTICFIENKVGSSEGFEQLKRYSEVLDKDYARHNKHLCYCTKDNDQKNQKGEYNSYNFKQLRWYEVAKVLREFEKDLPIVKDYLEFLEIHKMAQDNTIRIENLLTLENMKKTVDIMLFYINQSKQDFSSKFGLIKGNINYDWAQLNDYNRFAARSINILSATGKDCYSEILYSIQFEKSKLNVQLYVNNKHEQFVQFKEYVSSNKDFKFNESEWGIRVFQEEDLGKFLNNEGGDKLIKEWFVNSFEKFQDFIFKSEEKLNWNEKFIKRLKKEL